jgi:4a-hydroxytetrahydrobiopterin dehydratase
VAHERAEYESGRRQASDEPKCHRTLLPLHLYLDLSYPIEEIAMPLALAEKSCTPCRGGMPPLTQEEAANYRGQAPDWELLDGAKRIERTYRFKNFREAFAFVERAAALAEAEGHHPEIKFGWGYATVSLHTKKIKGLHENDFIIATKLDRIAAESVQATG